MSVGGDARRIKRPDAWLERPRGIKKWIEEVNPAYTKAISEPRGPFLHECRIVPGLAHQTIADAIRGAEAGLFPASGALTGGCIRCPFRSTCTKTEED